MFWTGPVQQPAQSYTMSSLDKSSFLFQFLQVGIGSLAQEVGALDVQVSHLPNLRSSLKSIREAYCLCLKKPKYRLPVVNLREIKVK
jgi:hypothetical protein